MISTVIEFASNPDIPVPINVDAQTSDNLGLIILGLILAATVGFLLFNVYKGKMSLNVKGMHSKSQVVISNNKFIAATLIAVAIAALMCIFCISNSAFAANGVNVTSTEKVTATYDQATGKVTFEEAFVTSEEETQLDFNSIQLKLMDGIDDGHCNWKIYLNDEVFYDDVAGYTQKLYEPIKMEPLEEFTITFETNMSPDVAYSLGGRQVATVNYDITEVQTYVNAKLNFHESSITPEGEKAISRNGWILKDGLYQKKEVKNSEIAPELAPLEEGMATGSIQKMYMMFTEWTILTVEDEPKVVDIFSKDVTIDAQWVDRPGLRGFVVDNAGEPVEGAIVNIYNKNTGEIVQSLITDENGKYIFENLPLGVEYYITYEKSGTPNLVAPTKEFTSYETIGELGNNEVTDESTVKGKIEGAPLSPQTWAVFYADDGSKYVAPVDSLGNYSLPVPAEQKGNLLFENDNPEVIIPGTPGLTTPGAGETSTLPNKNNLPKNQCESFSLNLQPAVEGAQFVISQYNYTDGNEYAFEATSDHDGNATLYAMPNLPGTIEVTYYDPFSRQNISYTQDVDGINAGEQFILDIDATKLRTVAMSISPWTIDQVNIPKGWSTSYTKTFVVGSSINAIVNQWNPNLMDHPEDEAFLCWSESTGQLAYDDGATKNISLMSSPKTYANFIKGKVVDSNGKPVSAARVDCLFTRETPSFFQTRITLATDRDGYYSMYMPNSFTKAWISAFGTEGELVNAYSEKIDLTISSESTTVPDIKLISGSTFTGNLTFSSYMPASYVTFSTADKQYVSFSNGDNYVLNVPTNIEGTLSVTPLVTDYNSPSCTIISAGAGEAIVQDFYLYREADLSKVNITIESQSSSSTYSLSYISDDKQFSIEEAGIAAGTHTYTVPPSTHGILKIVESVTGCVFIYGLDSAASGSSTTVSAIFRTFPTITAEVVDGTFIESKMPAFWSKESDTQYTTSKFIAGSTLDLCLQDIDKNAIATENLYYFKGIEHDPNVVLLTADTTVTFKCDHFISVKDKLYHKQDWDPQLYEVGTMNVVGDYTDNVLGYKILPFCSSILLVGPDNKVTTMISALITYSPYFVPETWNFGNEATEESGYVMSDLYVYPNLVTSWTPSSGSISIGGDVSLTDSDRDKLNKLFLKSGSTSWNFYSETNIFYDCYKLAPAVMEFLDLHPTREGYTFGGWLIPDYFSAPIVPKWIPNSQANGVTIENIIVSPDDEIYQEALKDLYPEDQVDNEEVR